MELNDEQKTIVGFDVGATVKAMAGAGTGKTRVLVERYLKFVFDDRIPPDRLLALTFTTKAASEMRGRIFEELRERGGGDLIQQLHTAWIMNFHQFCYRFISENASELRIDPDVEVATDVDDARIRMALYRRFQAGRIDGLPDDFQSDLPAPNSFTGVFDKWMKIVQQARSTLWTVEMLIAHVGSGDKPEYERYVKSIAALWNAYEKELRKRNLIDFSDMIAVVVRGLRENERLRRVYRGRFEHILVDEFQDTSEAQNELLRALAGDDFARVTVVGDDKQSIYRWRDARVENLREFNGRQEDLHRNYRSRQAILDLAHHFVIRDEYFKSQTERIRLRADRGATDVPVCLFHPLDDVGKSFEEEARGLTAWILSLTGGFEQGESPYAYYAAGGDGGDRKPLEFDDIAVLMRSLGPSSGLGEYQNAFRGAGIPYAVCGGVGSLEVRALQLFKNVLSLLVYPEDIHALLSVLEARPFSLPDSALRELFDGLEAPFDSSQILSAENIASLSDADARSSCGRARELIDRLTLRHNEVDFPSFVVDACQISQFYYRFFAGSADVALVESATKAIVGLVESLLERKEGNLTVFLESLEVLLREKSLDDSRGPVFPPGRVRVMTVHSAKGLEFPAVAVPGIKSLSNSKGSFYLSREGGLFVNDGKEWGRGVEESGMVDADKQDKEQEERCLLYVAMTRACDHLYLSSPFPGGLQNEKPNLFADILDVAREIDLNHEEVRSAPVVDRENNRRAAKAAAGAESPRSLLDRWSKGRERLAAAGAVALPVRGIEFVTWSELYDFSVCPLRFYYRHVAGAGGEMADASSDSTEPPHDTPRRPRSPSELDARSLGVLLHDFLCAYMTNGGRGNDPITKGLDEFAERYGLNKRQHQKAVQRATKRLNAFAKTPLADSNGNVWTERPVRARLDRLVFRAVFDRVDVVGDDHRVIDYKFETERHEYVYQVQFYAWVLRELGKKRVNEALLCYLQVPTKIVPVDISPDAIGAVDRDARGLEKAVATGRFDPRPADSCKACDFIRMCPHSGGSAAGRD